MTQRLPIVDVAGVPTELPSGDGANVRAGTGTSVVLAGAGLPLDVQNTTDSSQVAVAEFKGADRATPAVNDEALLGLKLKDAGAAQVEFGRISWKAKDVSSGTHAGVVIICSTIGGVVVETLTLDANSATIVGANSLGGELRLAEFGGSNYAGFKAAASLGGNIVWELPGSDGTNGQVMMTNAAGVLSWGGHDDLAGFSANAHIDWTNAVEDVDTDGTIRSYQDSSSTTPQVTIEQDGTGDAGVRFLFTGGQAWSVGGDNSFGDYFAITSGSTINATGAVFVSSSTFAAIQGTTANTALLALGSGKTFSTTALSNHAFLFYSGAATLRPATTKNAYFSFAGGTVDTQTSNVCATAYGSYTQKCGMTGTGSITTNITTYSQAPTVGTNLWNWYGDGSASNYFGGNVLVGTTTDVTGTTGKVLVYGDNTGNPTPGSNTCASFGKDVAGTVELFGIDEAGNATQLTSHAGLDAAEAAGIKIERDDLAPWVNYTENVYTGVKVYRYTGPSGRTQVAQVQERPEQDWEDNQDRQQREHDDKVAAWRDNVDEWRADVARWREQARNTPFWKPTPTAPGPAPSEPAAFQRKPEPRRR